MSVINKNKNKIRTKMIKILPYSLTLRQIW